MSYNTEKRNLLIEFLKENSQHSYTVNELCERILPDGRAKSTLYRLVSKLCEEGYLKKLFSADNRRTSYQYMDRVLCHEHLHLKCKDCGKLIHLDKKISLCFEYELLSKQGFELDGGEMIYGRCNSCRGGA